jgi:hypothetical protein
MVWCCLGALLEATNTIFLTIQFMQFFLHMVYADLESFMVVA